MMDGGERALLEDAVGAALAGVTTSAEADAALVNLGWLDMLEAEQRIAIAIVFEALGTANGTATALDDVLLTALGRNPDPEVAVLLPGFGAWTLPSDIAGGHVRVEGLTTARGTTARELLVVCSAGSGSRAVLVPVSAVEATPVRGIDPDSGFCTVRVEHRVEPDEVIDGAAWESAVALGRRAIAHQMLGASRAMLELARTHALERVQFGRSISSFQAVRHRLAEALVAVESLAASLHAAGDEPNEMTAALAKATAGRTAHTVAAHSQQVLAGIGFTTDHSFHRYLKRTMFLDGLFGSADEIALDLGRQLIAARRVPTLIEL